MVLRLAQSDLTLDDLEEAKTKVTVFDVKYVENGKSCDVGPNGGYVDSSSVDLLPNMFINPLKPNSSHYYTLPYRPNLPFLISDMRTLWRSGLSTRVPECRKLKMLGLYGAEHSKYNHVMTLGFKGLTQ